MKYYAGIGSRKTPNHVLLAMSLIAELLESEGYILRSGGADGSDEAFAKGCSIDHQEIYVPWKNFNKVLNGIWTGNVDEGMILAESIHEAWERCSLGAKKLHARNTFQILGSAPLSNPIPDNFVVCYTPGGADVGGTRTAIMLARSNNIPVFNMGQFDHLEMLRVYQTDEDKATMLFVKFNDWYEQFKQEKNNVAS